MFSCQGQPQLQNEIGRPASSESNPQNIIFFLAEKLWAFAMQKLLTIFSKKLVLQLNCSENFKDKYSLLHRAHPQWLLVLWPCYVIIYVRWGISFDELAAGLQIRRGLRDNFGRIIHIFLP